MTVQLLKNQKNTSALDWNALTEAEAVCKLGNRLGVTLHVTTEGALKATGNAKAAKLYLADIAARYRGAIIAHMLGLPAPAVPDEQDRANILINTQALDKTIADYCAAAEYAPEYREKLLSVRKRMAAVYLVQNLCAFRAWLYEVRLWANQ